jgi:hypothetical protein
LNRLSFFISNILFSKIPFLFKFLTQIAIKSHIQVKLKELKTLYTYKYSQTYKDEEINKFFSKAKDDCIDLSSTIEGTNFIWRIVKFTLFSGISALGGVILHEQKRANAITQIQKALALFGGKLLIVLISLLIQLFLGLISAFIIIPFIQKRHYLILNGIYKLEDNLFNNLNENKNKEFPIDFCVMAVLFFSGYLVVNNLVGYYIKNSPSFAHEAPKSLTPLYSIIIDLISLIILFLTRNLA